MHLRRPLAIYVRCATCTAENDRLRFLPDVYGRDAVLRRRLFGAGPATPRFPQPLPGNSRKGTRSLSK